MAEYDVQFVTAYGNDGGLYVEADCIPDALQDFFCAFPSVFGEEMRDNIVSVRLQDDDATVEMNRVWGNVFVGTEITKDGEHPMNFHYE